MILCILRKRNKFYATAKYWYYWNFTCFTYFTWFCERKRKYVVVIYKERKQAHHANTLVSSVLFYCSFGDKTVGELTQIVLYITIDAKTKDEMITKYFFGRKQ